MTINQLLEKKSVNFFQQALDLHATDLHLIPKDNHFSIVYRIQEQLTMYCSLPLELGIRLITYWKLLAQLDISEKRKPQSGSFELELQNIAFSIRLSTLPSAHNLESVALRFQSHLQTKSLDDLFFQEDMADYFRLLLSNRYGLICIAGATGTGKTTSAYSMLQYCAQVLRKNVIAIEDPIEIKLANVLQVQVNENAGLSYAKGIKSLLRHSPDIIFIGEIRDSETASIAMEAALTGHLVLSTIHASNSIGSIFRLRDLGVRMEDIRQGVLALVSQQLVEITSEEIEKGKKRKALVEILQGASLSDCLSYLSEGWEYELPIEKTIRFQLREGLLNGSFYPTN
ncbi:competence type IV pilus ATPase ComGA [Paenisporosarcina cavernae]|nr:competence type IV pilus ATPase ComGA [Paenisporosarcina cavernae]